MNVLEHETELKSRWGFHPCDYQTFLKVKLIHKHYWQSVYDMHARWRWFKKDEHNRRGAEPTVCPVFVRNKDDKHPVYINEFGIIDLYHTCKMPKQNPVDPLSDAQLERINQLYFQIKVWLENKN